MLNTSVNISEVSLEFLFCVKDMHIGVIWNYATMSLCLLLGTPALSWLLWLSLHTGWKIKPSQVFPLALTAIDLIFCFQFFIEILHSFVFKNSTVANLAAFFFGLSWVCKLLIQVCVCVEQYLAVVYPVMFLRYKGIRNRIAVTAAAWLMSLCYGLFLTREVVEFPDYVFLSACFIGVIVISFCCMSVLHTLKHPGPGEKENTKASGGAPGIQKRNAFRIISTVLFTVLLGYLPMASIAIFRLAEFDSIFFFCDFVPIMISFNTACVMTVPVLKLHQEGHLKCIDKVF